MMDSMIIGKYVPGSSLIHRLDPRTKLVSIFLFVCIVFSKQRTDVRFARFVYIRGDCLNTRAVQLLLKGLKPIIWIVAFTFYYTFS